MALGEQSPDVAELAAELLDAGTPIERRISALFSLRNILTEDSAAALAKGGRPRQSLFHAHVSQMPHSTPCAFGCIPLSVRWPSSSSFIVGKLRVLS